MPYLIQLSDGITDLPTVHDGVVDRNSTSIGLVGRNTPNYGDDINTNLVHMLENFSRNQAPANALNGQIWHDSANDVLRYLNENGKWVSTTKFITGPSAPTDVNFLDVGSVYFDETTNKAQIYDGAAWIDLSYSGTVTNGNGVYADTVDLSDGSNVYPVYAILSQTANADTPVAIFSSHDEFVVDSVDPTFGGLTIGPGMNLTADAADTALYLSRRSFRADSAYALNTGTYGLDANSDITGDGMIIQAANVFHSGANAIPGVTGVYDLGSISNEFNHAYVANVMLSGGMRVLPGVELATDPMPIRKIYTRDIQVSGNLIVQGNTNILGSSASPISQAWFGDIQATTMTLGNATTYSFPDFADDNSVLVNDSGNMTWYDMANVATEFVTGPGLVITSLPVSDGFVQTSQYNIGLAIDKGLKFQGGNLEADLVPFTTTDLAEGTNQYFTVARARSAFVGNSTITIDNGVIGVSGGQFVADVIAGNGLSKTESGNADVTTIQLDVKAGDGLVVALDEVRIDYPTARAAMYSGGTNSAGTVSISAGGEITINAVNADSLDGEDSSFFLNSGTATQEKVGALIAGGIRLDQEILSPEDPAINKLTVSSNLDILGGLYVAGNIAYNGSLTQISDRRLKENIEPLDNCLDAVLALNPVRYNFKGIPDQDEIGLIAQEVQQIVPEVVHQADDGKYLGVAYQNLVSTLIGAVQELSEKLDSQQNHIEYLEQRLRDTENR